VLCLGIDCFLVNVLVGILELGVFDLSGLWGSIGIFVKSFSTRDLFRDHSNPDSYALSALFVVILVQIASRNRQWEKPNDGPNRGQNPLFSC
jgi:hypothetical protein